MNFIVSFALTKSFLFRTFELSISFDETLYVIGFLLGYMKEDKILLVSSFFSSTFFDKGSASFFFSIFASFFLSNLGFGIGKFLFMSI